MQDLSTAGKESGFYSKNNGKPLKHFKPDLDVSQLMFFCANQLHSWVARCREWLKLTLRNLLKGRFISGAPRRVRQCGFGAGRTQSRSGDLTVGVSVFSSGSQPIYICGSDYKLLWERIWLNSGLVSLGLQVIDGQCGEVKKSSIPWFIHKYYAKCMPCTILGVGGTYNDELNRPVHVLMEPSFQGKRAPPSRRKK